MNGKIIITEYENKPCSFFIEDNRLLEVQRLDTGSKIGNIYIAKVKNVVKNLDACFVEIAEKEICFLPFKEASAPFCLNRRVTNSLVQGDEILVQITKDALKTKQSAVSCNINMSHPLFVFSVGSTTLGISSKLTKSARAAIHDLLLHENYIDHNGQVIQAYDDIPYGFIVRTQAWTLFQESQELFLQELAKCLSEFIQIFDTARHRTCFSCIQTSLNPFKELLKSYSETDCTEIVTDLNEAYTALQDNPIPVRLYTDTTYSLIKLYSLETKLKDALNKIIWLKSGANLVIEQTECLNTIDVNSGKNIKGTANIEDAIWQTNVEAAKEAATQIRLRNLSGIIIIDFINMSKKEDESRLLQTMKELVAKDSILTTVIDITPLGLMEITRQKVNKSLAEQFRG